MRFVFSILVFLAIGGSVARGATNVLSTIQELHDLRSYDTERKRSFDVTADLLFIGNPSLNPSNTTALLLADKTDRMIVHAPPGTPLSALRPGDRVRARGLATCGWSTDLYDDILTPTIRLDTLAHGPLPTFTPMTITELAHEKRDLLFVRTAGTVVDVFRDEIDRNCVFILLKDKTAFFPVDVVPSDPILQNIPQLLGARVVAEGLLVRNLTGSRLFLGPHLSVPTFGSIRLLVESTNDAKKTPELNPLGTTDPHDLAARGPGALTGHVLAVRPGGRIILDAPHDRIVNVHLADGIKPPPCGVPIRVIGNPATDLFHLNLTHASYQPIAGKPLDAARPPVLSPRAILPSNPDLPRYRPGYHGRAITLRGIVRTASSNAPSSFDLEADGLAIPVECPSGMNLPEEGSLVSASGIWAFDIDNWRADAILPRIRGYALVLRTSDDLILLAAPPWWTPKRFFAVSLTLFLLLVGAIVYNRILNRLIERRSRALFRERCAHADTELRIGERTRLAVELHDSLSQTLTGVSFRIDAAEESVGTDLDSTVRQLAAARMTLKSCRKELKNCLWDLRNDALEETNVAEAIRRTLLPHLRTTTLKIRFAVARTRFSDTIFHAVLRIIRELVVNAIRHGHATDIAIAGAIDGDTLAFSVQDNGSGFDPATRAGPDEGHFGLQGIAERMERANGSMEINSAPGHGTKINLRIPL